MDNNLKRLSENFYPGLIWGIIILIFTGLPGYYIPETITVGKELITVNENGWLSPDKIIHFIMFCGLSFLSLWGYRANFCLNGKSYRIKAILFVSLLTIAYSGLTELLQKYIFTERYCNIFDFMENVVGCILGIIIFIIYYKKKLQKKYTKN